ncbi:hypothetical protein KY343_06530 [Candidatus Woesearchaeota archaeon]|nr:hypothetical protein [Candidatus Woesearchaeota archaeon]
MGGIFEEIGRAALQAVYNQGDGSRHYTSRMPEEDFAQRHNSKFNYMMPSLKPYQGRADPADMVRKQIDRTPKMELYQNPVRNVSGEKGIYASLLNYKFMS